MALLIYFMEKKMRNSPKELNFIFSPSVLGWVEKYERTRGECICPCVCVSLSMHI